MIEKHNLADDEKAKRNGVPDLPSDGRVGATELVQDKVVSSSPQPVGPDVALKMVFASVPSTLANGARIQSVATALAQSLSVPQSMIEGSIAKRFSGIASALSSTDRIARSLAGSQSQIAKNVAVMNSRIRTDYPSTHIPVDPTPGLIRENLEVMREMLAANQTLVKRDEEREASKIIADKRARQQYWINVGLTGALVVLGVISVFEIWPR